jgi:hypothetical protein
MTKYCGAVHTEALAREVVLFLALFRFVWNATALSDGRRGAERVSGQARQS